MTSTPEPLAEESSRADRSRCELVGLELAAARQELERFLAEHGQPAYRAGQVLEWSWRKTPASFDEMSDLPRSLRGDLPISLG